MTTDLARRIETLIERAASVVMAAAVGFAAYACLVGQVVQPAMGIGAAGAGALAYLLCNRTLKAIGRGGKRLPVSVFDVRSINSFDDEMLVLREADRVPPAAQLAANQNALLLDDILAELGPDSRVVRLFDPAAMPSPGELKARIDNHLDAQSTDAQTADASRALHEALVELRRKVR